MPDGLGRDPRAGLLECPHREREALALRAEPVRRRDADAVEDELGRGRATDPHLVLEPADAEARRAPLDDEARQVAMSPTRRIRHSEHGHDVGHAALADEPLRPVEDVVVAVADRPGGDRPGVRPGTGLGEGERDERPARREIGQPARLLLGRARP